MILDVCCGSRMFWFDKTHPGVCYLDKRNERHKIDQGTPGTKGRKDIIVRPDMIANFEALPIADNTCSLVVFDPPHIVRKQAKGILTKKYGHLTGNWKEQIRNGFKECLRVLKQDGTLIFKWSSSEVPLKEVLSLASISPLLGNRTGKNTHWLVFTKLVKRPNLCYYLPI